MTKIINIKKEPLIYFLLDNKEKNYSKVYKKDILYAGETGTELGKRPVAHKDKKFDAVKGISSTTFKFLNNQYFRKYYELRCINKFAPTKYNKQKNRASTLNFFLLKMFLWFENPNRQWINPFARQCPFMQNKNKKWLEHIYSPRKSRWVINGYTRVWETLDLNKKLYIDNQNAFKFLINEKLKPSLAGKLRRQFTPRKEKLHN